MTLDAVTRRMTKRSRFLVAVMLVLTAVVGAGVLSLERSTSLDQFQGDTEESDALDYVDANFTTGSDDTTAAQVVVRDDDVLDGPTLRSILEYERALRENETIDETLVENDSTVSVANLVATAAIREDRRADLRSRRAVLDRTQRALRDALERLAENPDASTRTAFESVNATSSVTLTDEDYETFEAAAQQLRTATDASNETIAQNATNAGNETIAPNATKAGNETIAPTGTMAGNETIAQNATTAGNETIAPNATTATNASAVQAAYRKGTRGVLAEEYADLSANRSSLQAGIDPSLEAQIDALRAANESRIDDLVATVLAGNESRSDRALAFMPNDYDPGSTSADSTLLLVTQETPGSSWAAGDAPAAIEDSQTAMADVAEDTPDGSYLVFGDGIVAAEITNSMTDSLLLVGPLALAFVILVLVVAYRDLLDVLLGLFGVGAVLCWTFGTMGWLGVAFSQPFIVVVVLLIGLSIDYGIHVVMRYREARDSGATSPGRAMAVALGGVGLALVYVTITTVIGFLSNLASPLSIFREIGIVSAIGISAALLVFGVFVPALKVELDGRLERFGVNRVRPAFGTRRGPVNRVLETGTTLATTAPYLVVVLAIVVSGAGAYGATQIDTSFSQSDFLAEDPPAWQTDLPEPFAPGSYTAETAMDLLDGNFVRRDSEAEILVRGAVTDPATLDRMEDARAAAANESVTERYSDGDAAITSPLSAMERVADRNDTFAATLADADTDGDGVPDRNVTAVYDQLFQAAPDEAGTVIHRTDDGEYRALRMIVAVDGEAEDDRVRSAMTAVAEDLEGENGGGNDDGGAVSAIATGDVVVNDVTADQLVETVLWSLIIALVTVFVFLSLAYRFTEGSASLGAVTIVPVAFTLTWVLGAMAVLDIPFNIVTGLITGLTIGLGVDYTIHVSERFNQELADATSVAEALRTSVVGTGGALLSSATTTASGFAVLVVAILPFLQAFGIITALTIAFAFVASVFVLPSLLVLWARFTGVADRVIGAGETTERPQPSTAEPLGIDRPVATLDDTGRPEPTGAPGRDRVTHDGTDRDRLPHGGTGRDRPARPGDRPVRTLSQAYLLPDESVTASISIPNASGRVYLRETIPGAGSGSRSGSGSGSDSESGSVEEITELTPEPVTFVDRDGVVSVLWDVDASTVPSITYEFHPPADATDGDVLEFEGAVTTATGKRSLAGDESATVVADPFQRVIARGETTVADVEAVARAIDGPIDGTTVGNGDGVGGETAVERNGDREKPPFDGEITDEAFERLCRAWARDGET